MVSENEQLIDDLGAKGGMKVVGSGLRLEALLVHAAAGQIQCVVLDRDAETVKAAGQHLQDCLKRINPHLQIFWADGFPLVNGDEQDRTGSRRGVEELCAERVLAESTTTEQTAVWNYGIKALRESGQGFCERPPPAQALGTQVHGLIAVYGPKGGTGKTFVAVNLAVVLAERAKGGVVLVDLDLTGGDVAVHLNLMGGPTLAEAVGALEELGGGEIASYAVRHQSGLDALLAPPRPEVANLIKSDALRRLLTLVRRHWRLVVVDLPPAWDDEILADCLQEAEKVILVTTLEATALRRTRMILDIMRRVYGGREDRLLLVLNRLREKPTVDRWRAESFLGLRAGVVIEDVPQTVEAATLAGEPVVTNGKRPISVVINNLADLVCGENGGLRTSNRRPLFGWLRRGDR